MGMYACTHWEYIYDLAGFSAVGMGYVNGLNTMQ